ncbi:MAG: hypothetical protein ACO1SX_15955 [Actinomycetota bacterium]
MGYVLMLLADPGPPGEEIPDPGTPRDQVLAQLDAAADIRPDTDRSNRYWLTVGAVEAQLNLGSKDPIGSVHLELESSDPDELEAVTRRALSLAASLDMRVEDVLWGHEVTDANLAKLREFWREPKRADPSSLGAAPSGKPWWRFW